jgi:hypothetical protein
MILNANHFKALSRGNYFRSGTACRKFMMDTIVYHRPVRLGAVLALHSNEFGRYIPLDDSKIGFHVGISPATGKLI